MKKILLISLVTVLAVSLVGCNGNNNDVEVNNPDVNPGISGEISNEENNGNEIVDDEVATPDNNDNQPVEPNEPEVEVPEVGEDENVPSPLEAKITSLVEKAEVMMRMPMAMPITAETAVTFIGLSEADFTANIKDAIAYESMISPANSSVCLLELNDTADVQKVKQLVIDNCDPNKWICMSAEKCMVVDSGRYIVLVMSTPEECDAVQKVFAAEFGATGEALTK